MLKAKSDYQPNLAGIDPLNDRTFTVRKRDGRVVAFDEERVYRAIEKAFKADAGYEQDELLSDEVLQRVGEITEAVKHDALENALRGDNLEVERVQDAVETQLMKHGYYSIARRYIVYREERRKARALSDSETEDADQPPAYFITKDDGARVPLDVDRIRSEVAHACKGFEDRCSAQEIVHEVLQIIYDGVTPAEIDKALILAARTRIEREPGYGYVAARLLLRIVYREVLGEDLTHEEVELVHRRKFVEYLDKGIAAERLSPDLLTFDLEKISQAIILERDHRFNYMGVQTIYDRYLQHIDGSRIETPQYFWMRVAMGLAMNEGEDKNDRAIEFYNVFSTFLFTSSTPTLFNAGTLHPQLSSCYLSTVMDDLEHIFKVVSDDARLSKWAGGLGNDWSNVRATGGHIKGTNGISQGVIPFLKVANDTAVAVNQGGKRKGAMCAYLETWHLDVEDFLELRKNTGDERRRTHDMNTANWVPDLFMKRVSENKHWTLLNPCEASDLHDLVGAEFEKRYIEYENMADRGELKQHKRVEAVQLWRKMLSMLFETGHPWITFKDPSNIRSSQDHTGVVHSSNLCTEILLNTSEEETAVCNLGSVNLPNHVGSNGLNEPLLEKTITTALRMLDNVIDINFYPTPEAKTANMRHRPVGLGVMGFQDALYKMDISYASMEAAEFADRSMEMISYYSIKASSELAAERGSYSTFKGSKWDRGLLPIDTIELLRQERGGHDYLDMDPSAQMDWPKIRDMIRKHGVRNSNTMAIAPTATISNINGVSQSIEPTYKNLYAKSNLSGEFTVVNTYLVEDLKKLGLWDAEMIDDLKYFDGSIQEIERIPDHVRRKYITAFELEPKWLIECGSRRQKWIDMGQSLNLYIAEPNGKKLSEMYQRAWRKGLKTTYYLRSVAATQIEKSTMDVNKRGVQPRWMKNKSESANIQIDRTAPATQVKACSILDPECEACQ
jgi:ribonucleoside-diphosphate reductase alpha chain